MVRAGLRTGTSREATSGKYTVGDGGAESVVSRVFPTTPTTVNNGPSGSARNRLPNAAAPVESFQKNFAVRLEMIASPSRCVSIRSKAFPARSGIPIVRKYSPPIIVNISRGGSLLLYDASSSGYNGFGFMPRVSNGSRDVTPALVTPES